MSITLPRRALDLFVVFLLVAATTVVVVEHADPPVAEATTHQCVAGVLLTGAGFVATAMDPPAGVIAWIVWGSAIGGLGLTIQGCQTNWMINAVSNWRLRTCGQPTYFLGYVLQFRNFRWSWYAAYAGVGAGGGGGCSGSW